MIKKLRQNNDAYWTPYEKLSDGREWLTQKILIHFSLIKEGESNKFWVIDLIAKEDGIKTIYIPFYQQNCPTVKSFENCDLDVLLTDIVGDNNEDIALFLTEHEHYKEMIKFVYRIIQRSKINFIVYRCDPSSKVYQLTKKSIQYGGGLDVSLTIQHDIKRLNESITPDDISYATMEFPQEYINGLLV